MFKQALPILEDLTLILEKSSWKKKAAIGAGVGVLGALGALVGGEVADSMDFGGGEEAADKAFQAKADAARLTKALGSAQETAKDMDDYISSKENLLNKRGITDKMLDKLGVSDNKVATGLEKIKGLRTDMAQAIGTTGQERDAFLQKASEFDAQSKSEIAAVRQTANTRGTIAGGVGGLGLGAAGAAIASALGSKKTKKVNPNEYHKKYGKCPKGYSFDGKRCKAS